MKLENVSLEFLFYIKVKAVFSLVSTLSPTFILMLEVSCQSARRGHMHIFILLLHSLSFPCLSQSPDSSRTSHIQLSGFAGFFFFFFTLHKIRSAHFLLLSFRNGLSLIKKNYHRVYLQCTYLMMALSIAYMIEKFMTPSYNSCGSLCLCRWAGSCGRGNGRWFAPP